METIEKALSVLFPPRLPDGTVEIADESSSEQGCIGERRLRYHDAIDRLDWQETCEDIT